MIKTWVVAICACMVVLGATPQKVTQVETFRWVDQSTIALIEYFEGKRHKAYQDSEGNWTIGVGHLIQQKTHHLLYRELSEDEVMSILHRDLEKCSMALQSSLNAGVTRSQINALLSLCHNIGPDSFVKSEVLRYLNLGNIHQAADSFLNWANPPVLKKRRELERKIFLAGA